MGGKHGGHSICERQTANHAGPGGMHIKYAFLRELEWEEGQSCIFSGLRVCDVAVMCEQ
jgi:hypothetical protein